MNRLVVIDGNMLCYILAAQPNTAGILSAKASANLGHLDAQYPVPLDKSRIRPATIADCTEFRIRHEGYVKDPNYESMSA